MRLLVAGGTVLGAWDPASAQTASGQPFCIARPELEEGPYFLDEQMVRADIRADPSTGAPRPGVPLALLFSVGQVTRGRCSPLSDATVDLWQCDALGIYSGVRDRRADRAALDQRFLRGVQQTDVRGAARFITIYPGWYPGRTVHIHFKIRTRAADGQAYEFTSQLFFPDRLTDRIHAEAPYAEHGRRDTTNAQDRVYRGGGAQILVRPTASGTGHEAQLAIALDLSDANAGRPDRPSGRDRRGAADR